MIYLAHAHPRTGRGSVSKYRKKLNLGLTAGPVDHVVVPPGPPEREKVLEVIDGVYVAGSYTEFILHEYKQLLRIRSLLARGRATMAPSTPNVIARLFGGNAAASRRPRTRRSQLSLTRSAGVPDPIFWKVMEYWRLGDWRRPGTLPDPNSEE